jgi:hypothetical protein
VVKQAFGLDKNFDSFVLHKVVTGTLCIVKIKFVGKSGAAPPLHSNAQPVTIVISFLFSHFCNPGNSLVRYCEKLGCGSIFHVFIPIQVADDHE